MIGPSGALVWVSSIVKDADCLPPLLTAPPPHPSPIRYVATTCVISATLSLPIITEDKVSVQRSRAVIKSLHPSTNRKNGPFSLNLFLLCFHLCYKKLVK